MYRKKKVNTGITRIFRQHKFLEFRNLNVYDENPNSNFDFWYLFLFYEVVAESKITLWMDIRIIGIVGKLKPDILKAHCQSIHGPIERNYNDWNGLRTNKWWGMKITFSRVNISCVLLFSSQQWKATMPGRGNIATGETSPAITPYHFFGDFNFFNFHH